MGKIIANAPTAHRFGGDWTTRKLDVLADYLHAYVSVLSKQPFKKFYVDAFAGTGYRKAREKKSKGPPLIKSGAMESMLFEDLAEPESQDLLEGSARRALATDPSFDRYIFVDQSAHRCKQLESLKGQFPSLAQSIDVRRNDANVEIQALCHADWSSSRAVVFLDPYGMQVEWTTIEMIAETRAIDLWILFPLGMGVNRLLKRSGEIPDSWRRRLDSLLGTTAWYEEFYRFESRPTLFGDAEEHVVKASIGTIGRYFNDRLKSIFPGVAPKPAVLRNSRNSPLYLLCFAVGNSRAEKIALRIANHLLKEVR